MLWVCPVAHTPYGIIPPLPFSYPLRIAVASLSHTRAYSGDIFGSCGAPDSRATPIFPTAMAAQKDMLPFISPLGAASGEGRGRGRMASSFRYLTRSLPVTGRSRHPSSLGGTDSNSRPRCAL